MDFSFLTSMATMKFFFWDFFFCIILSKLVVVLHIVTSKQNSCLTMSLKKLKIKYLTCLVKVLSKNLIKELKCTHLGFCQRIGLYTWLFITSNPRPHFITTPLWVSKTWTHVVLYIFLKLMNQTWVIIWNFYFQMFGLDYWQ